MLPADEAVAVTLDENQKLAENIAELMPIRVICIARQFF